MSNRKKYYLGMFFLISLSTLLAGCHLFIRVYNEDNRFIYFSYYPYNYFIVNDNPVFIPRWISKADTLLFKCKKINNKLISKSYLQIAGTVSMSSDETSKKLRDHSYYRRVGKNFTYGQDYESSDANKYYVPKAPMFWQFLDISITSGDTSFGEEYPIGSDLTPLFVFHINSLREFINRGYTGNFTKTYNIRANDKIEWSGLTLFENVPTFTIDRLPTAVKGNRKPSITISFKFINKAIMPRAARASEHNWWKEEKEFNPKVTLLLDIEE